MDSKPKHTVNKKKEDGDFKKKHINHDPQCESSRAVFENPESKYKKEFKG